MDDIVKIYIILSLLVQLVYQIAHLKYIVFTDIPTVFKN